MSNDFFTAEVTGVIDETPSVRRYILSVKDIPVFDFLPGQFVMLDLPIHHEYTTRSYSIASAPNGSNEFELCIVLKEDGAGTPFLFKDIKKGSLLRVSAPQGRFVLEEPVDSDICFIATGTGVAPLRAMAEHIINKQIPHRNMYMVFGNRTEQDILYRAEFEQLATQHPEFKFIPVLSREENWQGHKGYVHSIYKELFADKRPAVFYICGWSNMVREAKNSLKEMGYSRKQINFELYD